MARHAIRRKLRPSAWAVVKNVGVSLGVAAMAVGAIALVATAWMAVAGFILAIVLLAAIVAFARILVVPATVAMLIAATLYLLGVVP